MSTLLRWATRGLTIGAVFSLPVPVLVVLVALFPDLRPAYPLVLLPLLAVGPAAVRGRRPWHALGTATVAGITSAVIASVSLAFGSQVLGEPVWSLVDAASVPPAPPLPRAAVLPWSVMTWAQQSVLVLQPLLAIVLGMLALLVRMGGACDVTRLTGGVSCSLRLRLLLAGSGVAALVGGVIVGGFVSLEDLHARSHVLQIHMEWQHQLGLIDAALDVSDSATATNQARTAASRDIVRTLDRLASTAPYPGLVVPAAQIGEVRDQYQPSLSLLTAAYAAQHARPASPEQSVATRAALNMLRGEVEVNIRTITAANDALYHQRLVLLLLGIGATVGAVIWLGTWAMGSIIAPLRRAVAHVKRVATGDFSTPAPSGGAEEFRQLARAADTLAADLARLRSVEAAEKFAAEARFDHEQVLARAGTALVAAADRDKIFQVAAKSALALTRQSERVRATVAVGPVHQMTVVAALGEHASETFGARMDIRRLLDGPNLELQQRRFKTADLGVRTLMDILGFRPRSGALLLTTLFVRRGDLTVIMLESDEPLGNECAEGVAKLGVETALALDNQRFNQDLLTRRSEARFRSLVQNSSDVVMIVRPDGVVQYQSLSGEKVFGYREDALIGTNLRDLIHPKDVQKLHTFLTALVNKGGATPRVEWRVHHANGSWIHAETVGNNLLDDPDVSGLVLNSRDIGDRRALQDQLAYQAFHDPLTTLPNRSLFMDRLDRALVRANRREQAVAMLFLDLDNFKVVNDSLGHQAGDHLLVAVAERLKKCVRSEDTVARLGGDEFTILIEDVRGLNSALEVADRVADQLRSPFSVFGHEVFSTASIGIAVSGPRVGTSADLLRNADLAMYRAKSEGRSRHVVFDVAMNTQAMKRLEMETALRRAVERGELRLMYQPIMSLSSMGIDRVETLVRWQHPERGLISPGDFIPLAEDTGLIVSIGLWILRESCRQARLWQQAFPNAPLLVMSVNLSPRQFQHPSLVDDITRILRDSGLDPERLELEITEGAVMEDADGARETLQKLRDIGISLAIDDFGTGYSSLGYLKRFPVSVLKIDQSFVRGLGHDEQDLAIVRGVIALAQSLNLSVTAEGIETFEQLAQLRELGCNHGQGYLLSRPLDGEALGNMLARSTVQLPSPKHGILLDYQRAAS